MPTPMPKQKPVRILIVDDHHELRRAIRNLLEGQRGFVVCGEAKDGVEAIQKSDELRPDVVVLNIIMPVMNGFEAARKIREVSPESRVVILSSYTDTQLLKEAHNVGAVCYVPKSDAERELIEAVNTAAEGRQLGTLL
jgi:DNA-binding NarL/FixJ family response regulator